MFCIFEAFFVGTWASYNQQPRLARWHRACTQGAFDSVPDVCHNTRGVKVLTAFFVACLLVYLLWWLLIAAVAWRELARLPYKGHRMANQTLRMSIGLTAWPLLTISAQCAMPAKTQILNACRAQSCAWWCCGCPIGTSATRWCWSGQASHQRTASWCAPRLCQTHAARRQHAC
jgi:hypothetical protein